MTQPLPPGTTNPYTGAVVVDSNGCYQAGSSNAYFTVNEQNYSGQFFDGANSCAPAITGGSWTPTSGPPN